MFLTYLRGQSQSSYPVILRVKLRSSTTPFDGKTALTSASGGLIISTIASNEATPTVYTSAGSTIETVTTLGTWSAPTATKCRFKLVDDTNHPGLYEIQLADARLAVSNAKHLIVTVKATGTLQTDVQISLVDVDPFNAVRFGLTALPNAAAEASGGLFTRGTGAGQINQDANGRIDVNAKAVNGTAQTARDIGSSVLLSAGTGTGQLDFTSGVVKANATQLLGTAWLTPGTAGTPDVNAKLIGATSQTGVDLGATRAEPGQGTPGATISFLSKIDYLYKAWRNKKTQTSTTFSLFNDDAATVDQKATVSDDGTTTTIGEVATGP